MSSTLLTRLPYFLLCTQPFSWIQNRKGLGCLPLLYRCHLQEGREQEGREQEGREQQDEGHEGHRREQEQGQPSAQRRAEPLKSCRRA